MVVVAFNDNNFDENKLLDEIRDSNERRRHWRTREPGQPFTNKKMQIQAATLWSRTVVEQNLNVVTVSC